MSVKASSKVKWQKLCTLQAHACQLPSLKHSTFTNEQLEGIFPWHYHAIIHKLENHLFTYQLLLLPTFTAIKTCIWIGLRCKIWHVKYLTVVHCVALWHSIMPSIWGCTISFCPYSWHLKVSSLGDWQMIEGSYDWLTFLLLNQANPCARVLLYLFAVDTICILHLLGWTTCVFRKSYMFF